MTSTVTLNDGVAMPNVGFGTWGVPPENTASVVLGAVDAGFRLIDTAAGYANETETGQAVDQRDGVFVQTKLANVNHGYDEALAAFEVSRGKLGAHGIDQYIVHWPCPGRGRTAETWRALVQLKKDGRVRSIGVSNFLPEHLQLIADATGEMPTVNQVELHPQFPQHALRAFHAQHGIVTQCWTPLGRGTMAENPAVAAIAAKHGVTWAQVVLAWHLRSGLVPITRSVNPGRVAEAVAAQDLALDQDDMAQLAALDRGDEGRIAAHPNEWGNP